MTKLGIIGAMQVEVEILLGRMENQTSRTVAGSEFHEGTLEGLPAVVVQCGVGKVNAALCAQILRDCFRFIRDYRGQVPGASARDCGN